MATLWCLAVLLAEGVPPHDMKRVMEMLTSCVKASTACLLPGLRKQVELTVLARGHLCAATFASTPAQVRKKLLDSFGSSLVTAPDVAKAFKEQPPLVKIVVAQPQGRFLWS